MSLLNIARMTSGMPNRFRREWDKLTQSALWAQSETIELVNGRIEVKADAIGPGELGILTTKGDLISYDTEPDRLAVGTDGQLLSANSAESIGLEWIDPPASSPLTTKGDIYTFDTDNARLPVGTDGQVLAADSGETTGLIWMTPYDSPTTTEGDLILRGATEDERLAIGTADQVLTVSGGTAVWADPADQVPLTTKGDLFTYDTDDARLPVGTDGDILYANSATATGLEWDIPPAGQGVQATIGTTHVSTAGTFALIDYDGAETFDTDGYHDPTTNPEEFTIPAGLGGVYAIFGDVVWEGDSGPGLNRNLRLQVNGVTVYVKLFLGRQAGFTNAFREDFSTVLVLAAGDTVVARSNQNTGADLDITSGSIAFSRISP